MTLQEAVGHATARLTAINNGTNTSARLEAQLLVCKACAIEQTRLIAHPEEALSKQESTLFMSLLARRSQGEPLAYIVGKKEFWSLDFTVNKHVLIPRPETELLVENALDFISENPAPSILDLGTGSGVIAISIAKERDSSIVAATDVSETALDVAKLNAEDHQVSVQFILSNWYTKLGIKKFDVIVCNPPYIAKGDPNLEPQVAQQEPSCALISEDNGLQDIELVIAGANQYLSSTGCLLVEHGFQQADKVQQLFNQYGFNPIQTHKDLAGLDRVTTGQNSKMA